MQLRPTAQQHRNKKFQHIWQQIQSIQSILYGTLTDREPKLDPPANVFKKTLKEHQRVALYEMQERENNRSRTIQSSFKTHNLILNTGILCDKVGSGKSITVLALIAAQPVLPIVNKIVRNINPYIQMCEQNENTSCKYLRWNVIVVPFHLVRQWVEYVETFTNLPYVEIRRKKDIAQLDTRMGEELVIVVGSTMYNNFIDRYTMPGEILAHSRDELDTRPKRVLFQRIIFDEIDTIKIPACRSINANFMWFLTSTYESLCLAQFSRTYYGFRCLLDNVDSLNTMLQNYTEDISGYSELVGLPGEEIQSTVNDVLQFLRSYRYAPKGLFQHRGFLHDFFSCEAFGDIFQYLMVRNHDTFVDASFELPEIQRIYVQCRTPHVMRMLRGNVDQLIMNYLNADDIGGLCAELGIPSGNQRDVIQAIQQSYARDIEKLESLITFRETFEYANEAQREESLNKLRTKVHSLRIRMENITKQLESMKSENCPICLDAFHAPTMVPCCSNIFCMPCLMHCRSNEDIRCPMCRASIRIADCQCIHENTGSLENANTTHPQHQHKKDACIDILKRIHTERNGKERVLIFSDYLNSCSETEALLRRNDISYKIVVGSEAMVNSIISDFKSDTPKYRVLLLKTSYFAAGMNLPETTDIILYHKMSSDMEKQVIGRGQRCGRVEPLCVHYLCYEHEYTDNMRMYA